MRYLRFVLASGTALFALFCLFSLIAVHAQTIVTAEAINQANVRAAPDLNADLLGQIVSGSQYPVIGRSDIYPWVLIADPGTQQPMGWVFNDLLKFQGDITAVPFTNQTIGGAILPTATLAAVSPDATLPAGATQGAPSATAVPAAGTVTGAAQGEINIRYGPGTEYDRLGVAEAGETFTITARHTLLPWVQISYPQSPNGYGWVAIDLLDIQGDLDSVQQISQTSFNLPTLTPTPSMVEQAAIGQISPEFAALGAKLWDNTIKAEFDPQTTRFGALYLQNLKTGETLAFEPNVAFSGMSINKIAILATLFGAKINDTPDDATANIIAEVMICSENISTNKLLTIIGDGDPYTGAERVTDFLQKIGIKNTFIYTPYSEDPFITPETPHTPPKTEADQVSASPDPYNQLTVSDMGMLLHDMYQCALTEDGPLMTEFDGQFTPMECRKMLDVMSYNHIYNFIEAGVPDDVKVAHKHGWVDETDGDAGIVFSPGGDYIFVMALHEPTWLVWDEADQVISQNSLDVYNYFNPTAPLDKTHFGSVPECNLLGNPSINNLLSPTFGTDSIFQ